MKNQLLNSRLGWTIVEILVTLSLIGIIGGIATVSYKGSILDSTKKNLNNAGKLFASAVNSCVQTSGGKWEKKRFSKSTESCGGKPEPCKEFNPCEVLSPASPTPSDLTALKNNLKKKLGWTCPPKATCKTHSKQHPELRHQYHCLSIEQEVSGQKIQVLVRISRNNTADYQIWCNHQELSTFVPLKGTTCKRGGGFSEGQARFSGVLDKDGNPVKGGLQSLLTSPCPW